MEEDKITEMIDSLLKKERRKVTHVLLNEKLCPPPQAGKRLEYHGIPILPDSQTEKARLVTVDRTPEELLHSKFYSNDLQKEVTVREWMKALLKALMWEREDFSLKRPLGDLNWMDDLEEFIYNNGYSTEETHDFILEMADLI